MRHLHTAIGSVRNSESRVNESEMTDSEDGLDQKSHRSVAPPDVHVWGFVLAGGQSRRMGSHKAHITLDGRSALADRIDLLSKFCGPDIAIVGSPTDETGAASSPASIAMLVDQGGRQGPLDGLITALNYAAVTAATSAATSAGSGQNGRTSTILALVLAVDLWNISATEIGRMLAVYSDPEIGPTTDVVHLCSPGESGDQPLCALWRVAESLDVLRPAFAQGERSVVRAWMGLRRTSVVVAESVLANINTPDDVEQWKLHRAAR